MLSLLFNLSACGFLLGLVSFDGFTWVMSLGRAAVLAAGRASGAGFAGFGCAGQPGQGVADVPESATDPGGGQAAGRAGLLPGQLQAGGQVAGEPQLGVGGDDQPGPPVGGG